MEDIKKFKNFFKTEEGRKCYARLLLHAGNLLRRYQGFTGQDLGLTPEDAVNNAIIRVLDGTRN